MALKLVPTSQFKKDYKKAKKRGLNMDELQAVLDKLCAEEPLEERHRDHALAGDYIGFRECHIRPDWLLIYAIDQGKLILTASRTWPRGWRTPRSCTRISAQPQMRRKRSSRRFCPS